MAGHKERAHALLSASGASRWIACPPSAQLEQDFLEEQSDFAAEGTAAHELAETMLKHQLEIIDKKQFNAQMKKHKAGQFYSLDMQEHIDGYVSVVMERVNAIRAKTKDALVLLEQRLDFSKWVPKGFGTGDVLIIGDGLMEIIDLKFGKGVPTAAYGNPQIRLYGLGALHQFGFLYDIDLVRMTIIQPRLDSITSDEMPTVDLVKWAEDEVAPKAELAMAGEGELAAGEHCRFCRVRYTCRARAEANLEMARYEFRDPFVLEHEEISDILARAVELQKWAADISSYALEQAEKHGMKFPGWKLVEGRSNRKITNKEVALEILLKFFESELVLKPQELFGLTDLEKNIGKDEVKNHLSALIIKPMGKPTLVPESDKRVELSSAAAAAEDFK